MTPRAGFAINVEARAPSAQGFRPFRPFRPFRLRDRAAVSKLHLDCFGEDDSQHLPPRFYVDDDATVCGGIADFQNIALICNLAVSPDHRSKGLGKRMIRMLVTQGLSENKRVVVASRDHNIGFYEKNGFVEIDREGLGETLERVSKDIRFLEAIS